MIATVTTPPDSAAILSAFAEQCRRAAACNVELARLAYAYLAECGGDWAARAAAVKRLAGEMRAHKPGKVSNWVVRVNTLVKAHAVRVVYADLFVGRDHVPWHLLTVFYPLVRRGKTSAVDFVALPGVEAEARELVRATLAGEIHFRAARELGRRLRERATPRERKTPDAHLKVQREWRRGKRRYKPKAAAQAREPAAGDHPLRAVFVATARDAASMLARGVADHPTPDAVCVSLLRELLKLPSIGERNKSAVRAALSQIDGRVAGE
jgi:hypothetical protein